MDLAAEAAGIEIIAHCEPDPWCRERLAAQWPGTIIYEYDSDITADRLRTDGLWPIDILLGGPPCQSVSLAGKRLGPADPRFRWPDALRILGELLPAWVVWENPPGLASAAAGAVLGSIQDTMAEMGYTVGRGQWGAADLGAPHRRERIFIVGRLADPSGIQFRREWPAGPDHVGHSSEGALFRQGALLAIPMRR